MKSFKQFLSESWKKHRTKKAFQRRDIKDGKPFLATDIDIDSRENAIMSIKDEEGDELLSIEPNRGIGHRRYDIGIQRDRGGNKRFRRLSDALERDGYSRDLSDKVHSAAGRDLGRIQFRGAKLRGQTPGPRFDEFLTHNMDEYSKNYEAFFKNKQHRELVGTSVGDLSNTRDWYRFHKIYLRRHLNDRIPKFLDNLHQSGRIVKSTV